MPKFRVEALEEALEKIVEVASNARWGVSGYSPDYGELPLSSANLEFAHWFVPCLEKLAKCPFVGTAPSLLDTPTKLFGWLHHWLSEMKEGEVSAEGRFGAFLALCDLCMDLYDVNLHVPGADWRTGYSLTKERELFFEVELRARPQPSQGEK